MEENIFKTLNKVYDLLTSIANREACFFHMISKYAQGKREIVKIYPKYNQEPSRIAINDEIALEKTNSFFNKKTQLDFIELNAIFSHQKQSEFNSLSPNNYVGSDVILSILNHVNVNQPNQTPYIIVLQQKCLQFQKHNPLACALAQKYLLSVEIKENIEPLLGSSNELELPKKINKI